MLSSTTAVAIKTKTKDPLQQCHTVLHSLTYLPRVTQRCLRPYQLILCLGSVNCSIDSTLAANLSLRLVHVDASRAEEIANIVMALFLGLLRRTHLLSRHALSVAGWLGSVQPLCRGMQWCRGLVLGIIGRSASARSLATRSLAFKISVLYFDVHGVFFFSNFYYSLLFFTVICLWFLWELDLSHCCLFFWISWLSFEYWSDVWVCVSTFCSRGCGVFWFYGFFVCLFPKKISGFMGLL